MLLFQVSVLLCLQVLVMAGCPNMVSRKDWDAVKPVHVKYLTRPVDLVIIQHTATATCKDDKTCEEMMRSTQDYHMEKLNYWDIGSSFYVGGNGKIYEGVGWLKVGAHTYKFNDKSIGISFIGNYNNIEPTDAQLEAVKSLLKCGVEEEHLSKNFHVVGHKQLIATESPGRKLYNAIRRWPEWLEDVSSLKKMP